MTSRSDISRRLVVLGIAAGGLSLCRVRTLRAACALTPGQAEGPFFPVTQALESDLDLTQIAGRPRAEGQVIEVSGRVLDGGCRPQAGVVIEVWQANARGRYDHPRDRQNAAPLDPNFQGYARLISDAEGGYRIRTIKPAAYPVTADWWRPPHIHFKIQAQGLAPLTTQLYFAGEELNGKDRLLGPMPEDQRRRLEVALAPGGADNLPRGQFDLVLA